jgi:Protein of unknown function (DUF2568)
VPLTLRAVMEAGIVCGLAVWGYHTASGGARGVVLGIVAAGVGFGIWGAIDFRSAGAWAEPLRLVEELVISLAAAAALIAAGRPALGWALAALSVTYHVVVYALGGRLLEPGRRGAAAGDGRDPPPVPRDAGPILEVVRTLDSVTIRCSGAISAGAGDSLQAAVDAAIAAGARVIRFDLRATWLDSHGTALVLSLYDRCLRSGVRVEALTAPAARRVFTRLGLPSRYRLEGGDVVRIIQPRP